MRGITIILNDEELHTGNDLDLVQEIKSIGKPTVQSYTAQIPGRNGLLNLTKGLTGKVMYNNRPLSFQYFGTGSRALLLELDALMSRYHGETIKIIDDDYPNHYYEGEASVSTAFNSNYITITLSVDAQPFRLKLEQTTYSYEVDGSATLVLENESVEAIPTVAIEGGELTISFNGENVILSPGEYTVNAFALRKGMNTFEITGSGTITFTYQEGAI